MSSLWGIMSHIHDPVCGDDRACMEDSHTSHGAASSFYQGRRAKCVPVVSSQADVDVLSSGSTSNTTLYLFLEPVTQPLYENCMTLDSYASP